MRFLALWALVAVGCGSVETATIRACPSGYSDTYDVTWSLSAASHPDAGFACRSSDFTTDGLWPASLTGQAIIADPDEFTDLRTVRADDGSEVMVSAVVVTFAGSGCIYDAALTVRCK